MRFIGVACFLFIWAIASYGGLSNPVFIPAPHAAFWRLLVLLSDLDFYLDFGHTIYRMIMGLVISGLIGIPIGLLMGCSKKVHNALELLIDFFRSIPATAMFPLALLLFGIGDMAKIGIVVFSCSLVLILQTYYGVSSTSRLRRDALAAMGASKTDTFKHLLIWEAMPYVFAGIRIVVSLSLILVLVTEMFIGTDHGLGRRLIDAQSTYRISELYAVIIFVGGLGYFLNRLSVYVEKRAIHWR